MDHLLCLDSYIEDGKNPDLFSKSFIEAVAGENQFTNGKITALKASLYHMSFLGSSSSKNYRCPYAIPPLQHDFSRRD